MLRNTDHYTVGTWYDATYGSQSAAPYLDFGGTGEPEIRPPASAAFALATSIATGTYDPATTGVTEAAAIAIAKRLTLSVAYRHEANSTGGWGTGWQEALWAAYAGAAGWLLDTHLTARERVLVQKMVVREADYQLTQPATFWKDAAGVEQFAGNSQAEENAWNSMILQTACVMLPDHPNHDDWFAHMQTLLVAAWSVEADALAGGWNVQDDGTVINHNILHPDYMAVLPLTMQATALFALAERATPSEAFHNTTLVYDAFTEITFTAPPWEAPGGTIYITGDDALYYPEGTDWGTSRRAHVMAMDAMVDSFGLAVTDDPEAWGTLHADAALAMQQRDTTGQTYQPGDDDIYAGREQWVAAHAAQAWLARWVVAAGLYP